MIEFPTDINVDKLTFRLNPQGVYEGSNTFEWSGDVSLSTSNFQSWMGGTGEEEISLQDVVEALIEGLKVSMQKLSEKSGRPDVFQVSNGVALVFSGAAQAQLVFDSTEEEPPVEEPAPEEE
jgi:phage protein U